MKKLFVLLLLVLFMGCEGEMQTAQREKAYAAEREGLNRVAKVIENGVTVWEKEGKFNLEKDNYGFVVLAQNIDSEILAHKIIPSTRTLVIIEELPSDRSTVIKIED